MTGLPSGLEPALPEQVGDALPRVNVRPKWLKDYDSFRQPRATPSCAFRRGWSNEATHGARPSREGSALGPALQFGASPVIGLNADFVACSPAAQISPPGRWTAFQELLPSESGCSLEQLARGARRVFARAPDISERIDDDAAN